VLTTKQIEPLTVIIPSFGECTLLPVDTLPEKFRSYEKLLKSAEIYGFTELPDLPRHQVQEIFKVLACKLSERGVKTTESISVLLSGSHDAYPKIDITDKNQKMEKCVLSMEFFFWEEASLSIKGELIGGPVDMQLDEIPVGEFLPIMGDDSIYCLFVGV
jgi:hypothetical protein